MSTAKAVLLRILLMGLLPGCLLGCAFMFAQTLLPAAFTTDPTVIASVAHVIPVLAVCMVRTTPPPPYTLHPSPPPNPFARIYHTLEDSEVVGNQYGVMCFRLMRKYSPLGGPTSKAYGSAQVYVLSSDPGRSARIPADDIYHFLAVSATH